MSQQVIERLQTEKSKKAFLFKAKKHETDTEKKDYVKKISELEGKLEELKEEADDADEMVKTLMTSQRQVNDEVEEARAVILDSKVSALILEVCSFVLQDVLPRAALCF